MLTWVEIKREAFKHNLAQFRKIVGPRVRLMAVVKSNAYGHGMIEVAKIALKEGADWLGVINLDEALELRQAKIKAPIFILSYWDISEIREKFVQISDCDFPVYTLEQAKILSKLAQKIKRKANIHIKIDTGASRIGILPEEAVGFAKYVKKLPDLNIRGIFTHYAASESKNQSYTNWQTERFKKVLKDLEASGTSIPLAHAGCSASTIANPNTFFDMVRIGIGMYGLWPSGEIRELVRRRKIKINLKPALSWKTKIIQVKNVAKNTFIGYDCTYRTKKKTKIAVLPIGYWDGYDRLLSNSGQVLVHGKHCPIRGRICMNLTMVDVSGLANIKTGDEVVLVGSQGKERIRVEEIAHKTGTINYEVVTRINPLIPRIYI